MTTKIIIAIDGPSCSGKGTIARGVAKELNLAHLDTGLLYRAVGLKALTEDPTLKDEAVCIATARAFDAVWLGFDEIRSEKASAAASKVAAVPEVRDALLAYQRDFAVNPPHGNGAILDGRDIGTVICPKAPIKLFVTAALEERAKRRYEELKNNGGTETYEEIFAYIQARDARDSGRESAPLKAAEDALLIDTTKMSIKAAIAETSRLALEALRDKKVSFACV